jgi:hypothetical protein
MAQVKEHLLSKHKARVQTLVPQKKKRSQVATQEAEIRRITVWNQPEQIVCQTLSQKNPSQKRAGGVAQGLGPEFNPQYYKKNKKKKLFSLTYLFFNCVSSASKCISYYIFQF